MNHEHFCMQLKPLLFILLLIFATGCGTECDYPQKREQSFYGISLNDSINEFISISYLNTDVKFDRGNHLSKNYFHWNLVFSQEYSTLVFETTFGFDTLVYQMKKEVLGMTKTGCDDDAIAIDLKGPYIIAHSFDSVYFENKSLLPGLYQYINLVVR